LSPSAGNEKAQVIDKSSLKSSYLSNTWSAR
jgi:hypothetical protein